jgi:hypothetical protein
MAQKITVALEDDLDGGPADETVRFGLGGTDYEIDLSTKNATAFRRQLAPFIEHARKTGRGQRGGRSDHVEPGAQRGHPGVDEGPGHHGQRPRAYLRERGRAVRRRHPGSLTRTDTQRPGRPHPLVTGAVLAAATGAYMALRSSTSAASVHPEPQAVQTGPGPSCAVSFRENIGVVSLTITRWPLLRASGTPSGPVTYTTSGDAAHGQAPLRPSCRA